MPLPLIILGGAAGLYLYERHKLKRAAAVQAGTDVPPPTGVETFTLATMPVAGMVQGFKNDLPKPSFKPYLDPITQAAIDLTGVNPSTQGDDGTAADAAKAAKERAALDAFFGVSDSGRNPDDRSKR